MKIWSDTTFCFTLANFRRALCNRELNQDTLFVLHVRVDVVGEDAEPRGAREGPRADDNLADGRSKRAADGTDDNLADGPESTGKAMSGGGARGSTVCGGGAFADAADDKTAAASDHSPPAQSRATGSSAEASPEPVGEPTGRLAPERGPIPHFAFRLGAPPGAGGSQLGCTGQRTVRWPVRQNSQTWARLILLLHVSAQPLSERPHAKQISCPLECFKKRPSARCSSLPPIPGRVRDFGSLGLPRRGVGALDRERSRREPVPPPPAPSARSAATSGPPFLL